LSCLPMLWGVHPVVSKYSNLAILAAFFRKRSNGNGRRRIVQGVAIL